jgi:hypothetical protein
MNSTFKRKRLEIRARALEEELDLKAERHYNWCDIQEEKFKTVLYSIISFAAGVLSAITLFKLIN